MRIAERSQDAIRAHAVGGYPYEVCGVLLGPVGDPGRVTKVVAVANRETDAARVRYQIAPSDWLRVQRAADEEGLEIVGFYHSHPDHPARPSETDRRIAAEGLSDGVFHVVVGVQGGGETTVAAFIFSDAPQAFQEVPLDVEP